MRQVFVLFTGSLCLGLIFASAAMNYRFGASFGQNEFDQILYGSSAAVADLFKAVLLVCLSQSLASRQFGAACAAIVLWVMCLIFSFSSNVGYIAGNRADELSIRTFHADQIKELKKVQQRYQGQLDWHPRHRQLTFVESEIAALMRHNRWRLTKRCTNATTPASTTFCNRYNQLDLEKSLAKEAQKLEARLEELRQELQSLEIGHVTSKNDAQALILARLTGIDLGTLQDKLILLMAILIEAGSSLGLFIASNLKPQSRKNIELSEVTPRKARKSIHGLERILPARQELKSRETDIQKVEEFIQRETCPISGATIGATSLYEAYLENYISESHSKFSQRKFGEIMGALGYREKSRCSSTRRIQYHNLTWRI